METPAQQQQQQQQLEAAITASVRAAVQAAVGVAGAAGSAGATAADAAPRASQEVVAALKELTLAVRSMEEQVVRAVQDSVHSMEGRLVQAVQESAAKAVEGQVAQVERQSAAKAGQQAEVEEYNARARAHNRSIFPTSSKHFLPLKNAKGELPPSGLFPASPKELDGFVKIARDPTLDHSGWAAGHRTHMRFVGLLKLYKVPLGEDICRDGSAWFGHSLDTSKRELGTLISIFKANCL